jgi:hypothetical protein
MVCIVFKTDGGTVVHVVFRYRLTLCVFAGDSQLFMAFLNPNYHVMSSPGGRASGAWMLRSGSAIKQSICSRFVSLKCKRHIVKQQDRPRVCVPSQALLRNLKVDPANSLSLSELRAKVWDLADA